MKIYHYLYRIQTIHRLIRRRQTGTPAELAQRLDLSESMIYNYIGFMKENGAPIAYSKRTKTYYYTRGVDFSFGFRPIESRRQEGSPAAPGNT